MTKRYLEPDFIWIMAREKVGKLCANSFEPRIEVYLTTFPQPLVIQHGKLYYLIGKGILKASQCDLPQYDNCVREIIVKYGHTTRAFCNHSAFVQWLTGGEYDEVSGNH